MKGYAFTSVAGTFSIGVMTAMNETGLNFGDHSIYNCSQDWKGIPNEVLNRNILENAASVEEVGEILKKAPRSRPWMHMVTDTKKARIYAKEIDGSGHEPNPLIIPALSN